MTDDWDVPTPSRVGDGSWAGGEGPAPVVTGPHLGRGSQGIVVSGRDRHLPREVAWKLAPAHDAAGARLRHEARVLAMLEHPHIVPVHDLVDDGINVRMATRFVRGRTMRASITPGVSHAQATRLLRHMLAVCQAVAFAHGRGVVHRDVKPDNVMIGDLGETQLIDWGLAQIEGEVEPAGAVVGTPAYMSPEQARGEHVGPASDVWSLGVTLGEVVTGLAPWGSRGPSDICEALRQGERPAFDTRRLPRELAAILGRALQQAPEARYPDARALADDLEAYLDGRIVSAHDYSGWQRLKRFVSEHRASFAVGSAVTVTLAVVLPLAFARIGAERDQAVAARADQTLALARAETTIAIREHAAGHRGEAEEAAANALSLGDNPDARGVLAAWSRAPRPRIVSHLSSGALPDRCRDVSVSPDGRWLSCGLRTHLLVARVEDGVVVMRSDAPYASAAVTNRALWWSGGATEGLRRVDLATGETTTFASCGRELEAVGDDAVTDFSSSCEALVTAQGAKVLIAEHHLGVQCMASDGRAIATLDGNGVVRVARDGAERRVQTPLRSASREFTSAALLPRAPGQERAVFATTRGRLYLVDLADGRVVRETALATSNMVRDLDIAGGHLLALVDGGGAQVLSLEGLAMVTPLPVTEGAWAGLLEGGRIATFGDGLTVRVLDDGPVAALDGFIGVTSATLDADGALLVTHKNRVSLVDTRDGHVIAGAIGADTKVFKKAVRRGATLHVAVADNNVVPTTAPTVHEGGLAIDELATTRRLDALPDGRLVWASTGEGLFVERADGAPEVLDDIKQTDLAVDGAVVAALARTTTSVWDVSGPPELIARCDARDASAIALLVGAEDPTVLEVHPGVVLATDRSCSSVGLWVVPSGEVTRVVGVGPVGAGLVIAGTRAGELLAWRWSGELVARVTQHLEPVSSLSLDGTGRWIVSGAWDGRVRFFALAALDTPIAALVESARVAWTPR